MSEAVSIDQTDRNELFRHKSLTMDQCDVSELFTMTLGRESIAFKLCDLIAFKRKIFAIDLVQFFDAHHCDIEIVYLPHLDRHILFSLEELLGLRELLDGTFAVLQINSQVQRSLYNPFAGNIPH